MYMKTCKFIVILLLLVYYNNSFAQIDPTYITDGEKGDFVWGHQLSNNNIAIGLGGEGSYKLNETFIWRTYSLDDKGSIIASVVSDRENQNIIYFIGGERVSDDNFFVESEELIGSYNTETHEIFDRDGKAIAVILNQENKIINNSGKTYINFNFIYSESESNLILPAFFFIWHYYPLYLFNLTNSN